MLKQIAIVPLVLFIALAVQADDSTTELARKVIAQSGAGKAVASIPEQLTAQYHQRKTTSNNPELDRKATRTLLQAYDEQRAQDILLRTTADATSMKQLKGILEWLQSPAGKKIASAENHMQSGKGKEGLQAFLGESGREQPGQERIDLLSRFENASRQSATAVAFYELMARSMMRCAQSILPEDQQLPDDVIDEQFRAIKADMQQTLRQNMLLISRYTYRDISNEEMEQYIEFLRSDSGRRYTQITIDGMRAVFDDLVERAIPEMKKLYAGAS